MPLNISARRDLALSREQAQNTKGYTHPGGWRARSSQENTGFSKIAPGTGVQGQTQGVPLGVIVTEPALAPNASLAELRDNCKDQHREPGTI